MKNGRPEAGPMAYGKMRELNEETLMEAVTRIKEMAHRSGEKICNLPPYIVVRPEQDEDFAP